VALDRQSIMKKDFPIGRRGYEPDAVDAHLSSLAGEVDQLRSASKKRPDNLATIASEQIRSIIEAAEHTAAEIERLAQEDATAARNEADADATKIRADASAQGRDHVEAVSGSASSLLSRIDAMEKELAELLGTLRTGANRVHADLGVLKDNMTGLRASTGTAEPAGAAAPPAAAPPAAAPPAEPEPEAEAPPVAGATPEPTHRPTPTPRTGSIAAPEHAAPVEAEAAGPEGGNDAEGARLVALNMALNGSPREETDAYLAEHYALDDRAGLLEEVYATVEG
jgi:DivIVA protein